MNLWDNLSTKHDTNLKIKKTIGKYNLFLFSFLRPVQRKSAVSIHVVMHYLRVYMQFTFYQMNVLRVSCLWSVFILDKHTSLQLRYFSELVVLFWSKQQNGRPHEAPVCCAGALFLVLDSRCVRRRSNARGPCSGSRHRAGRGRHNQGKLYLPQ